MKRNIMAMALIGLVLCNSNTSYGQATTAGFANVPQAAGEYLGWANGNNIPLKIQNINAYPIDFYTGTTPTKYMTILGSTNPGYVGIGTATPGNLLHLYNSGTGAALYSQWSNGNTTYTSGMIIGINTSNEGVINMQDNRPIDFLSNNLRRGRITAGGNFLIGDYASFTTNNQLVQYAGSNTATYHQFVASNTNTAATDGFRIGITNNSGTMDAELRQGSNAPINFLTNAAQRMIITGAGDVGIGTASPGGRLHVDYSTNGGGITSYSNMTATGTSQSNFGIYSAVNSSTGGGNNVNYGFSTAVNSKSTDDNYGCQFIVADGNNNFGVEGISTGGTNNYGIKSSALGGSNDNYGLYAFATGPATSSHYIHGVHAEAAVLSGGTFSQLYGLYASGGNGCTNGTCVNAAGYFSGDILYHAAFTTSDLFLKENILPIGGALGILGQLNPVTYTFKSQQYPSMHLNETNNFGLISEEVESVLPELVKSFSEPEVKDAQGNIINAQVDFKAINYQQLIPILIKAIQEQQLQIQALQPSPNPGNGNNNQQQKTGALEIKLSDKATVVLGQNEPNPFKENTTITFNIPEDVKNAQILFYNTKGNVISTVEITERGAGSLLVYGSDLTSGVYTYTLLIEGTSIETKKMMKVK